MDDKRQDWELIRKFVDGQSQPAFAELTKRYFGLVHATALRELGERTRAEDVTQAVFLILAHKAHTFRPSIVLAAWLFDTCKFTAKNEQRIERRREVREQKIAMETQQETESRQPHAIEIKDTTLNAALCNLPKADRQAVLHRFVCGYSFQETGEALGVSEDAARMRIVRALEKLRHMLIKTGAVMTTAAIADLLHSQSVQAASPVLEGRITDLVFSQSTATLAGIPAYTLAQGVLKSMTFTTLKITAAVTCGLVLAGGTVYRTTARAARPVSVAQVYKPVASATSGSDPKAVSLFKQMIAAYGTIKTCSFTENADGPGALGMPYNMRFTFEQPEKYEIRITHRGQTSRILYQGSKVLTIPDGDPSQFTGKDISKSYTPLTEGLIGAADVKLDPLTYLLTKTTRDQLAKMFATNWANGSMVLLMGRRSTIDGTPVDTLISRSTINGQVAISYMGIGHKDHLIRRITSHEPSGDYTINYSNIKVNQPIPPETFRFTPPSGG